MNRMLIIAAIAAGLAGCSKKGPECNSVVSTVNPNIEKMKKASSGNSDKAADQIKALNDIAAASDAAVAELAKLTITVPEVQKFVTDYSAACKDASAAAKDIAAALAVTDSAEKSLEKANKDLTDALDKQGKACAASADDAAACKAFVDAMPTDHNKTEEVTKGIDAMEKVAFKSDTAKSEATAVITALKAQTKIVTDAKAAQAKAEAASKKIKATSTSEDAAIDSLNKFCAG